MHTQSARYIKIALICLALIAIGVNIFMFRRENPAGAAILLNNGGQGAKPTVYRDYDLNGAVPGNPKRTMEQMRQLYRFIGVYQQRHGGAYPTFPASATLLHDRADDPKAYGFSNTAQAVTAFRNPDMKYADSAHGSLDPASYDPYRMTSVRPDGATIGSPKPDGTRDVLAYTEMYYHRNIRYLKGGLTASKPAGFYLVLWDDGQVEQVPWDKAKYLGPQGTYPTDTVFDGQAGLPATGVHTYDEYQKWKHDNL